MSSYTLQSTSISAKLLVMKHDSDVDTNLKHNTFCRINLFYILPFEGTGKYFQRKAIL